MSVQRAPEIPAFRLRLCGHVVLPRGAGRSLANGRLPLMAGILITSLSGWRASSRPARSSVPPGHNQITLLLLCRRSQDVWIIPYPVAVGGEYGVASFTGSSIWASTSDRPPMTFSLITPR